MIICDKLRQLFKGSGKSIDDLLKGLIDDSKNPMITAEEYEKNVKKVIGNSIKKISSLTKEEKRQKIDEVSRGFQYWSGVNMEVLNLAPLIKRKYEITRHHLKEYQDALKK
jgi:hypothetical protein